MVRDDDPTNNYNNLLDRVIRHRDAIISHLNWVCIFLGFHSFGLYIHNDTMSYNEWYHVVTPNGMTGTTSSISVT